MKKIYLSLGLLLSITACSTEPPRQAVLVPEQQANDMAKSCPQLVQEMNAAQDQVAIRGERSGFSMQNLTRGNIGVSVTKEGGVQDVGNADQQEALSFQRRYEFLDRIARYKHCY